MKFILSLAIFIIVATGYVHAESGPYQNVSSGPYQNVTSGFFQNVISGPFRNVTSGFFQNVISGPFRNVSSWLQKFLAPPSPSNLPQPLGQWQQEPTPTHTPTPTINLKGEVQTKPFVYKQEAAGPKTGVPSFTINAPSGWVKTGLSGNELVRFESPEIDIEEVKGGTVTTNAIINIRATGGYSSLDDFVSQYKASGSKAKGLRLLSEDGYRLEFKFQSKVGDSDVTVHELNYLFFKNGVSFLIKGYASDSAWDKHSGEIRSALNSFKFNK